MQSRQRTIVAEAGERALHRLREDVFVFQRLLGDFRCDIGREVGCIQSIDLYHNYRVSEQVRTINRIQNTFAKAYLAARERGAEATER